MLELLDVVVAIMALEAWTADGPGRPSLTDGAVGFRPIDACVSTAAALRGPPPERGSVLLLTGSAHHAVRGNPRRRPVLELHAERKAALGEDFLDLGERLLAEVRRLEQFDFGLLDQIADVVDALGLEAVGRTHGQLQ